MSALLVIWVMFLVIVGAVLFLKMRVKYLRNRVVKNWCKVNGCITHINSNNEWYDINKLIPRGDKILIRYTYEYSSTIYSSTTIYKDSDTTFISSQDIDDHLYKENIPLFIKSIKANPEVMVWVNPENPKQSVLVDISPRNYIHSMVGLVVIIWAICITIICSDALNIDIAKKVTVIKQKENPTE